MLNARLKVKTPDQQHGEVEHVVPIIHMIMSVRVCKCVFCME